MESSSSAELSCLEQEPFNPDRCLRVLPSISVEKRDGTIIPIPAGGLVIRGGANVITEYQEEDDTLTLSVIPGSGQEDPYLRQKADALSSLSGDNPTVSGPFADPITGITPEGDAWTFTVNSMWIGSVNNVQAEADTGAFFVVNDNCVAIGEFEDTTDPGYPQALLEEGSSSAVPGAYLKIFDVCAPCLDCLEYQRLYDYLARIEEFYDYIFALTQSQDTDTPPVHPDGGTPEEFVGVHPQLMSALRYWDYLVHINSVKVSAQSQGQSVTASAYYKNISVNAVGLPNPDGVQMELKFEFKKDGVLWTGMSSSFIEVRILDRAGKPSAAESTPEVFSPSTGAADTVTVYMDSTNPLASGEEAYGDVAILFKNTNLFNDETAEYTMVVTLMVLQTHLDPVVQTRSTIVYFQPTAETDVVEGSAGSS